MAWWRRKQRTETKSTGDGRQVWTEPAQEGVQDFEGLLSPEEMPPELRPKSDPRKTRVFDDEIDPEWRDPDTAE